MPELLRPGMDGDHPTFCRLCEAFCGLVAKVRDGVIETIGPDRDNPLSRGHLCVKGPAITALTYSPDRVTSPLKRVGGPGEFVKVSWDEALDDIAARLRRILDRDGGQAFASYVGNPAVFSARGWVSAEAFTSATGSRKRYSPAPQDTAARAVASRWSFGSDGLYPIPDLEHTDFLLVLGANPMVSHGGLLTVPRIRHYLDAIAARGRVLVVDPRRTETARLYEHQPIRPGSDVWLLAAMLQVIIERGLVDEAFVDESVEGWPELRQTITALDLSSAAERTGIAREAITELALQFAQTERAVIYSRVGICRTEFATLTNALVDALNIVCGKLGRNGGLMFGFSPVSGRAIATGRVPRSRIGDVPGAGGFLPGVALADDILEPGEGRVRALMVTAGNPVLSAPGEARLEAALEDLELLFALDFSMTETNRHAHYILSTTTFVERDDYPLLGVNHMIESFIQYTPPVIPPVGEARNEYVVYRDLAKRMGLRGLETDPMRHFNRALRMGPVGDQLGRRPGGLSFAKLRRNHPHGALLDQPPIRAEWRGKIAFTDGRVRVWHEEMGKEFARLAQSTDSGELLLFGRRHLKSLNSWMHSINKLVRSQRPTLMVNPLDAAALSLADGDKVRVSSATGSVDVIVELSDDIVRGAVCYPHGWGHPDDGAGKVNINRLATDRFEEIEQVSGTSILDGIPVTLAKVAPGSAGAQHGAVSGELVS